MELQEVKKAIENYFSDTSRSAGETKGGLQALVDDLQMKIESIPDEPIEQ